MTAVAGPTANSNDNNAAARTDDLTVPATTTTSSTNASGQSTIVDEDDGEDRIRDWRDVVDALALTWRRQRKHLFVTWIHVPIGVTLLLVITWALRLAIEVAPFRFPAPVIAMLIFFVALLALDWLSIKFPGAPPPTNDASLAEKGRAQDGAQRPKKRRRFVDPVMMLLAPPCEFCLRNMSVMFTPSFILIPAREVIPGKEIGLLAAWFIISQVLAFVLPVWFNIGIGKTYSAVRQRQQKRADAKAAAAEDLERAAAASRHASRRGSMATLSGVDYEKGLSFHGGQRLGAIATGLSGVTAHIIAPVTHVNVDLDDDFRRQIESTAMEFARQQGDPAVTCRPRGESSARHNRLAYDDYRPKSDVSSFQHHAHHGNRSSSRRPRSRSRKRSFSPNAKKSGDATGQGDTSLDAAVKKIGGAGDDSDEIKSPGAQSFDEKAERVSRSTAIRPLQLPSRPEPTAQLAAYRFPALPASGEDDISALRPQMTASSSREAMGSGVQTAVASRRPSVTYADTDAKTKKIGFELGPHPERRNTQGTLIVPAGGVLTKTASASSSNNAGPTGSDDDEDDEEEEDAISRLASWFGDLITPTLYLLLFIIGIPLFFVLDFALPLFLGINLLTFIASITIVPPKVRRFLHPILSTSLATVLIIWAFAAMKGIGLKNCLNRFYSVDAKYTELWRLSGYNGPVPGAGDILFSTLDAGIVALAVPMYRYRKELRDNLTRMLIVLFPCAALSLFFWNYIARLMGMDAVRSLAFSARFMSTPLAIELANNIGADESITVILVVITGVVAAILKEQFFYRWMRVDRDDYLTVGLTMGATSGAIGASSLISTPRTMAIASLAFVLFGTILLVCTAIPPIVDVMRMLAGA